MLSAKPLKCSLVAVDMRDASSTLNVTMLHADKNFITHAKKKK